MLVFVLIDGLDATSSVHMSYLSANAQAGALCGTLECELPTVSRAIYSTLFTGYTPLTTGVTNNKESFFHEKILSNSFFIKMRKHNKICAMAAYHWMYELYAGEKFCSSKHRLSINPGGIVPYGIFYNGEHYPDEYVFQDAEALRLHYEPDFLLVHSMGVDTAGHGFGADSVEYRDAVRNVDILLAEYIPTWLAAQAMVIVTSDHGMHKDGSHNDLSPDVRQVPYWILGAVQKNQKSPQNQTDWYKLLCNYYGFCES